MTPGEGRDKAVADLERLLAESDAPRRSLVVVNRTEPEPIMDLLDEAFGAQPVSVSEDDLPETASDTVLLLEDSDVVATSSLGDVMRCCLMVNGDLYRTGTSGIDKYVAPPTITGLDEVVFDLKGFPASNKQKLLLIIVSRFIERRALLADSGRLRSTFQRLSRLEHEEGTRRVYERLRESDIDVHVYGIGDAEVPEAPGFSAHAGSHRGYRETWCVVFVPDDPTVESAALVALETGDNEWRGMWTFDREKASRVDDIIREHF